MSNSLVFKGFAPVKYYYTEVEIAENRSESITLKVAEVDGKYKGGIIGHKDIDDGSLSMSYVDSEEDCLNELVTIAKRRYSKKDN